MPQLIVEVETVAALAGLKLERLVIEISRKEINKDKYDFL